MEHEKGFIKWNGKYLPFPKYLTEVERQQLSDDTRNAKGVVIASKVNRRQVKIKLTWPHLTAREWADILEYIEDFIGDVSFYDPLHNRIVTRRMYWGNSTETIFKLSSDKSQVEEYINCTCNLIDCGGELK